MPSVTEIQYFLIKITLLLLKFSWNFGQNTEICLNFSVVSQNTEICVKIMQNYWNYCNLLTKESFQTLTALGMFNFSLSW